MHLVSPIIALHDLAIPVVPPFHALFEYSSCGPFEVVLNEVQFDHTAEVLGGLPETGERPTVFYEPIDRTFYNAAITMRGSSEDDVTPMATLVNLQTSKQWDRHWKCTA